MERGTHTHAGANVIASMVKFHNYTSGWQKYKSTFERLDEDHSRGCGRCLPACPRATQRHAGVGRTLPRSAGHCPSGMTRVDFSIGRQDPDVWSLFQHLSPTPNRPSGDSENLSPKCKNHPKIKQKRIRRGRKVFLSNRRNKKSLEKKMIEMEGGITTIALPGVIPN